MWSTGICYVWSLFVLFMLVPGPQQGACCCQEQQQQLPCCQDQTDYKPQKQEKVKVIPADAKPVVAKETKTEPTTPKTSGNKVELPQPLTSASCSRFVHFRFCCHSNRPRRLPVGSTISKFSLKTLRGISAVYFSSWRFYATNSHKFGK